MTKESQAVAAAKKKNEQAEATEISIKEKLLALYSLQQIDSQIDKIKIIRGELPLEVQDLEDEIEGLQTRISKYQQEVKSVDAQIDEKKQAIKDSAALIKRYEEQVMNVRNSREYDSINKEIEFQNLEMQLSEKRIAEFTEILTGKTDQIKQAKALLKERESDLRVKKSELKDIVKETEKEEKDLTNKTLEVKKKIEDRLLLAYARIRKNARNGLAVVQIERDACGGCFNKIPPQHQLDIRMHKKIIVCEYCGRILVDDDISKMISSEEN
jgi:uncharacterized protein